MILQRSSFFLYPPAHLPPWRAWSRPVTFQCRLLRLYPAYGVSSCAHLSARPLGWLPAYILTDLSVSGSDRLVFKGPDQSSTACPGWCENPPETMNYRLLARMAPARKTGDGQSGSRIEACRDARPHHPPTPTYLPWALSRQQDCPCISYNFLKLTETNSDTQSMLKPIFHQKMRTQRE